MKNSIGLALSLALVLVLSMASAWAGEGVKDQKVFGKSTEESFAGKVVVIKVGTEELNNRQRYIFVRRMAKRAEDEGAKAIVFDLNTPGGYAWETAEFLMKDLATLKIRTLAYVNPSAVSAGAMVALGTDAIYMAPASAIGAAGVITPGSEMGEMERAKAESYLIAAVRGVAEQKGHDPDIASAMMELKFVYEAGNVYIDDDELLTLNALQATQSVNGKPLLAKGVAKDLQELLEKEGLADLDVVEAEPSGLERIAFIAASFSGLLILVGIGGAYLEMKAPGFGIGGVISLLAFGLFFFGNYLAGNMVGYGLLLLFLLGVVLVIVEFVVLPGTLIPGIAGGILILVSLFTAMIDDFAFKDNSDAGWSRDGAFDFSSGPILNLSIGIIGSIALMLLMMRFLPKVPLFNKLVMGKELGQGAAIETEKKWAAQVGKTGEALTDLRPVGKAKIDGKTMDVTASTGFIPEGTAVTVVSEDGLGIVVEASC